MIRRIHISSILLLFIVAVASCRYNEMEPGRESSIKANDNHIAFQVGAAQSASSQTKAYPAQQGRKVFLCADGTDSLYLSASVSDNTTQVFTGTPAVKGAQVTTENLELFHVTANVDASLRYFPFTAVGQEDKADDVYTLDYYWPQDTLDFFATNFDPVMTPDPLVTSVLGDIADLDEFEASLTKSSGVEPYSYTSISWEDNLLYVGYEGDNYIGQFAYAHKEPDPSVNQDARFQPDYVFAISQNRSQNQGVVPLRFAHCFSAVTFRIGSAFMSSEGRQVKSIRISGVPNTGTCDISEQDGQMDFVWHTDDAERTTFTQDIASEGDATNIENNQIINADELTFMLIPHEISEDETITITFGLHAGEDSAHDWVVQLKIRDLFADDTDPEWLPGKRYTYTIVSEETVDIQISDEFISTDPMIKGNLDILNKGIAPVYVRAYVIGWWENESGDLVHPWVKTDGQWSGTQWTDGVFVPGAGKWKLGGDGFFYYSQPLWSGDSADPLFDTYTLQQTTPPVTGARLILNVVTQAIIHYKVSDAWPDAGVQFGGMN
ncbi:MAG: fimbrillin family protein [Bacteroidales bacterium]|nr:fimbrillin family protein [Bacteroidales bacterium]